MFAIEDYQIGTGATAIYRENIEEAIHTTDIADWEAWLRIAYCAGKLNGEAGEVAEEVFKAMRDDSAIITAERKDKLFKEIGDVCWYISQICTELGFSLADVMDYNLTKLQDRKARDVLSGSGSDR